MQKITESFFALTETGVANEDNKALLETGNERPDWFTEILNIVTDKTI